MTLDLVVICNEDQVGNYQAALPDRQDEITYLTDVVQVIVAGRKVVEQADYLIVQHELDSSFWNFLGYDILFSLKTLRIEKPFFYVAKSLPVAEQTYLLELPTLVMKVDSPYDLSALLPR